MLTNEMSDLSYTCRLHCIAIDTRSPRLRLTGGAEVAIRLTYDAAL